jgi:hypothetical protein
VSYKVLITTWANGLKQWHPVAVHSVVAEFHAIEDAQLALSQVNSTTYSEGQVRQKAIALNWRPEGRY